MDSIIFAVILGTGAFYVAKRGRGAMRRAVGWTARQMGWLSSQVRLSLDETKALAREQYERGRAHGAATPIAPAADAETGNGAGASTHEG